MSLHELAPERIEISPVMDGETTRWMIFVIGEYDDEEWPTYGEIYPTREAAVAAASTWGMPVRFIHEVGVVVDCAPLRPTSTSGIPLTRRTK